MCYCSQKALQCFGTELYLTECLIIYKCMCTVKSQQNGWWSYWRLYIVMFLLLIYYSYCSVRLLKRFLKKTWYIVFIMYSTFKLYWDIYWCVLIVISKSVLWLNGKLFPGAPDIKLDL